MLRLRPATIGWRLYSISQASECRPLCGRVSWVNGSVMGRTHEFIEHDKQPDACEIHGIALAGDDELADALRLETGPPRRCGDAVGGRAIVVRAVDDGDVRHGLRRDFIETETDISLQLRLARG